MRVNNFRYDPIKKSWNNINDDTGIFHVENNWFFVVKDNDLFKEFGPFLTETRCRSEYREWMDWKQLQIS